jgi:hypothetical protein
MSCLKNYLILIIILAIIYIIFNYCQENFGVHRLPYYRNRSSRRRRRRRIYPIRPWYYTYPWYWRRPYNYSQVSPISA